jgi:hypothetical protein
VRESELEKSVAGRGHPAVNITQKNNDKNEKTDKQTQTHTGIVKNGKTIVTHLQKIRKNILPDLKKKKYKSYS